jgi:hypothetical protein
LALTLLRVAVAAAAMAMVLLAFGTGDVSFLLLVAGGAVGSLAYALTLLVTREITMVEIRRARTILATSMPRVLRRAG